MKALEKMSNVEKGKLLADLLPDQLPNITLFMEQEIQRFLKNEQHIKSHWTATLVTADFWFRLVQNIEKTIQKYGNRLHKNYRWFADQLFDSYDAIFTIHCLVEYSLKEDCNDKLRQAVHLLFGRAKLMVTDFENKQQ